MWKLNYRFGFTPVIHEISSLRPSIYNIWFFRKIARWPITIDCSPLCESSIGFCISYNNHTICPRTFSALACKFYLCRQFERWFPFTIYPALHRKLFYKNVFINFFFYFYCDDFDLESDSFLPMYVNLLPLNLPKLKIPKVAQQFLIVEFMLTTVIHCFIMFCCPYDYLTLR
jgi:hypothetical protein